jgi:hypothetical protein
MNTIAAVNQSTTNANKQQKQTAKEVIASNVESASFNRSFPP